MNEICGTLRLFVKESMTGPAEWERCEEPTTTVDCNGIPSCAKHGGCVCESKAEYEEKHGGF